MPDQQMKIELPSRPVELARATPGPATRALLRLIAIYVDDSDRNELEARVDLNPGRALDELARLNAGVLPGHIVDLIHTAASIEHRRGSHELPRASRVPAAQGESTMTFHDIKTTTTGIMIPPASVQLARANPSAVTTSTLEAVFGTRVAKAERDEIAARATLNPGYYLDVLALANINLPSDARSLLRRAAAIERRRDEQIGHDIDRVAAIEQRRSIAVRFAEVSATSGSSFLEGRAVPYMEWADIGAFNERHAPGSFAESIALTPNLPLLLFHQRDAFPIGVTEKWLDNPEGLDVIWRLDSSELAQEAARLARDGIMFGLSIGFQPIDTDREVDQQGRHWYTRTRSRLHEVSLVSTPAFPSAGIIDVHGAASRPGQDDAP